ncbi:MAG: signal peptide peptidase SppA [Clostridiales Family XIII bacterium]|jgi:protease-4|nr:signal peptide peptidase SppA [Clostridiales Family XIII bacterium]
MNYDNNNNENNNINNSNSGYQGVNPGPEPRQPYTGSPSGQSAPPYQPYQQTYAGPPPFVPRPQKRGMSGWIVLLIVVVICASMIFMTTSCISSFTGLASTSTNIDNTFTPPSEKYIARMYIVGEIADSDDKYSSSSQSFHYRYTLSTIDKLIDDENNAGLILYINSPGGGVYESDETYLKVREYKEKTERPVYVYMGGMAASGGYYISAAADKIYANRNTWTGSIGVISGTFFDVSEFLTEHGIKATDITSGPNKGMGSYFEPMTKEQRAILQTLVDEAYEQFVGIVSEGRKLDIETTKKIADGRIYTAKQAKENGLIDDISGEREAYDAIRKELGDEDMRISDFSYAAQETMLDLFGIRTGVSPADVFGDTGTGTGTEAGSDKAYSANSDVSRVLELTEKSDPFELKYLFKG